jgi:hypothetical protein
MSLGLPGSYLLRAVPLPRKSPRMGWLAKKASKAGKDPDFLRLEHQLSI